jgi:CBS-domain-containing membrane protein
MVEAVELATIVANLADLPPHVVEEACRSRLREHPVRSLAGQAALAGAVARLAEEHVARLLADPIGLAAALGFALKGTPLAPAAIGVTRTDLFREAGLAAAKLPT